MKHFTHSFVLKLAAFIMCILCIAASVYTVTTLFFDSDNVYRFENSFEGSYFLRGKVNEVSYYLHDEIRYFIETGKTNDDIYSRLSEFPVEYYAQAGDYIITNNNISDEAYYKDSKFIYSTETTENSEIYTRICIKITDDYVNSQEKIWTDQEKTAKKFITDIIIMFVLFLISFIYLLWVCGKKSDDDETHMLLIDRMFVEINVAVITLSLIGSIALILAMGEGIGGFYSININYLCSLMALVSALEIALITGLVLSLVRNIKNRSFLNRSLIKYLVVLAYKLVKKIFIFLIKILRFIKNKLKHGRKHIAQFLSKKTGKIIAILFTLYTITIFILTMIFTLCIDDDEALFYMLLIAITFIIACIYIAKRISGFDKIKDGIFKIRNGEIGHRISGCPEGVMANIEAAVNTIGDGLSRSLEKEMRAERLKSELITNVSHDLKTPLTSIINYSDLLCQQDLQPQEANDYAKIINQKSLRLKNLTSDLFDISKVQSGNEKIILEELDIVLLIKQTLGELDESIKNSNLSFQTSFPESELNILGDGKKLSRVFENIIGNAIKYSMKNTRVYLSVKSTANEAQIEIKNISAYEMNFGDNDITERFIRGDESRTTDGSGLGLAIAKSYVEACEGKLSIITDGDLFKLIITLKLS